MVDRPQRDADIGVEKVGSRVLVAGAALAFARAISAQAAACPYLDFEVRDLQVFRVY